MCHIQAQVMNWGSTNTNYLNGTERYRDRADGCAVPGEPARGLSPISRDEWVSETGNRS